MSTSQCATLLSRNEQSVSSLWLELLVTVPVFLFRLYQVQEGAALDGRMSVAGEL